MLTRTYIEHLLTFYDLGELQQVAPVHQGNMNETVIIQTTGGRFVVRYNRQHWSDESHRYRHALMTWLYEQGFAVPRLVCTHDGNTFVKHSGRVFEIQAFVAGHDYDPYHAQQLAGIGATLARYHYTVREFTPRPDEAQPRYSTDRIMGLTERLMEADVMGDLWATLTWYDTRAAHLRADMSRYTQLPYCIIHGDMHSDNLRFVGDKVVALLDYDQIAWDARLVDLADALVSFASTLGTADHLHRGVFAGPLSEERAARLLEGYMNVSPLDPGEVALLPTLVELIWLQGELIWVASSLERPPEDQVEVLAQGRWLANWMRNNGERLMYAWTDLNIAAHQRHEIFMAA